MNGKSEKEERLTLELLNAIDRQSDVSQRNLASNMGVALGLANSYLKRCVRKGLIKISEAPANRYLYYLTPQGFAEKSRLTAQYLSTSLTFYRQSAESCAQAFETCADKQWHRVLLCGLSDLAEIALLRGLESDVDIVGTYDPTTDRRRFFSKPVWRDLDNIPQFDVCLLTDLTDPLASYRELVRKVGKERVLVPGVLGLGGRGAAVVREESAAAENSSP
jgi:DNA-binding MarR family transcriptional regulator